VQPLQQERREGRTTKRVDMMAGVTRERGCRDDDRSTAAAAKNSHRLTDSRVRNCSLLTQWASPQNWLV